MRLEPRVSTLSRGGDAYLKTALADDAAPVAEHGSLRARPDVLSAMGGRA